MLSIHCQKCISAVRRGLSCRCCRDFLTAAVRRCHKGKKFLVSFWLPSKATSYARAIFCWTEEKKIWLIFLGFQSALYMAFVSIKKTSEMKTSDESLLRFFSFFINFWNQGSSIQSEIAELEHSLQSIKWINFPFLAFLVCHFSDIKLRFERE